MTLDQIEELACRFTERRIVDNEQYEMVVTDKRTNERAHFAWTFGGGKQAMLWKLEQIAGAEVRS